ncbi:MAG: ADP-ribosylglycohydrolase family protein, partial [Spirochaetota bacterium]
TSACLAFIGMLWELLDLDSAPEAEWWPQRYVELAHDLEGQTNYSPRGGRFTDFHGPLWQFVHEKLAWALQNNLSTVDACNSWYSGAFLLETVPSVLYILMRHADDPQAAIQRAVNDTQDNDTVAAIVGAAVGALHGRRKLPQHLVEGLVGRTGGSDDGRVFELIRSSRLLFA